ncbi:Predicted PurR-regulated permease PerM [Flavobacterium fluvii]|uniref:Predicted PurR-regulated permease PerM n=1 Tax=Flavobacterium fluvii TaxID=468056 RepID=A0A1M5LLE0_9FLAO|nr:AI-2E family transporter [Flavobacterium fluvii]SHG65858.1 Predicted PurR-regulated permease PerM [Flavobacterium fluvii]
MESQNTNSSSYNFEKIVDTLIRLGVLSLLLMWCLDILRPFILILIWAIVIAVAIYPIHVLLSKIFRGRNILASIVLISIMLSLILIPSGLIMYSLYEGINHFRELFDSGKPLIPPPGGSTANWPTIAKPIVEFWQLASENLQETIVKYSDQIKEYGSFLLLALAGIGKGLLFFIVSIIIAGVLLIYADSSSEVTHKIFKKLVGDNADNFTEISVLTIRNVVKGILGVAIIQTTMAGLGFFMAGVPFAGLWTVLCLILAIIQVGIGPIAIPVVIYVFSVSDATTSIVLAIWIGITLVIDNVLKPILLGRNAPAPMLVIFLGAIGGFIFNGFIGLFLGAIILTIGYKLFMMWLETEN